MPRLTTILAVAGLSLCPPDASAQELSAVRSAPPLVLRSRGSFFVGGEPAERNAVQLSSPLSGPPDRHGRITTDQMYVEYMVPASVTGVPVVMLHGGTLSGKSYDTTPDGRMGWYEYFVRRGHAVYVPDQVSRGRSGVDTSLYNEVRAGLKPPAALPNVFRFSDKDAWSLFRFGPRPGVAFPDEQFPVEAIEEFAAQSIPDFNAGLVTPNPNVLATSELARQVKGAVVIGHSETGTLPLEAALSGGRDIKGMVLIEPGGCLSQQLTPVQIALLRRVPILVVFGDHLDLPNDLNIPWGPAFEDCKAMIRRVNAAGGSAQMLHPPELGIRGNSHMIMQDRNNQQIADLILQWIDRLAASADSKGR